MKSKIHKLTSTIVIATLILSIGCKKKENKNESPQPESPTKYALMATGGTYPNETSYFWGTEDFPTGTQGTSTAAELASSGIMYKYGSYCYITTFGAPATLRKYSFDSEGKPTEVGSFIVQGLNTFGAVDFVSETEAYAASNGYGGIPKVIKFNPSNMQITGTIDLTSIQKSGANNVFYLGMVHRGNYLYMGVNYQSGFSNYADSVYVAIINKNTGNVEKLISDGRCGIIWSGGSQYGFSGNGLIIDENNDIYVQGTGNGASVPSGVIRLKNGENTFDPTYFFNLQTATGADCLGLYYYGNGKAFTCRTESPADYPTDGDTGPNYKYYKINLTSKSSDGELSTDLPKVFGWTSTFISKWDNNTVYLNVPAANSNSIYSFNISNGTVQKEFDISAGACNGFAKLK